MDSFIPSWPLLTKGAVSLGFALGATVALAQGSPSVPTPKLIYRSVWAQYQGFTEQSVTPWQQTNDTVERVAGGLTPRKRGNPMHQTRVTLSPPLPV